VGQVSNLPYAHSTPVTQRIIETDDHGIAIGRKYATGRPTVVRGTCRARIAAKRVLRASGRWTPGGGGHVVSRYVDKLGVEPIGFVILLVAGALAILRWKVRIDDRGISRRWLYRWDHWPWDHIASGRIEKRHPHTLYDPSRPWWRRRLSLEILAAADIRRHSDRQSSLPASRTA
jgi:hypothetical protein